MPTKPPDSSPGTVSKILWHFTGGPSWNEKTGKQNANPKSPAAAYANLKSIIQSQEIRLGTYKERVKAILPRRRRYNSATHRYVVEKNVPVVIESAAVCCLSDIPSPHLRYHAYRYGKFAIGFRREAVIEAGFNPVFYTLEDTPIIRAIHSGIQALGSIDSGGLQIAASNIQSAIDGAKSEHYLLDIDIDSEISDIETEGWIISESANEAMTSVKSFLAYTKTFGRDEFSTIYCEREWRSTSAFGFSFDDVAMIVLPKKLGRNDCHRTFVERTVKSIGLPRRIPIVPWDDLIEH
jgi:hypothetical protein